ncbi:MAG: HIRAN domain-containing protein [Candidatus Onthomorpha sp.]
MKAKRLFFKECNLAGRRYYDADLVWSELSVGTPVRLEREADNRYDENAVAVMYDRVLPNAEDGSCQSEEFFLGYIPARENEVIAQFMDMGWEECFSCTISRIDPSEHYENQIRLTIRINRNEQ